MLTLHRCSMLTVPDGEISAVAIRLFIMAVLLALAIFSAIQIRKSIH